MTSPAHARGEGGYVATVAALLAATVLLGVAAISVDVARWYVERERLQSAADAAALAGVVFMPQDLATATTTARDSAARNGFVHGAERTTVSVSEGDRPSQLRVTITRTIDNGFGAALGVDDVALSMSATADYTGPAPMGSPCNTFANQPPSQSHLQPTGFAGATLTHTSCKQNPNFWAAIQGPATNKVQGDRYSTVPCASGTYGCTGSTNSERRDQGYFFALKVAPAAVNRQVQVQVYDPAYVHTQIDCSLLPSRANISSDNVNDYATTDARNRYSQYKNTSGDVTNAAALPYCSGDYNPGASGAAASAPVTSFAVREQTDTNDPTRGAVVSGCTKQFAPTRALSVGTLARTSSSYNRELARTFHQWVELCRFTPTRPGDYYVQVRTNVPLDGTSVANSGSHPRIEYQGNPAVTAANGSLTTGTGLNSFALRAVNPANPTVAPTGVTLSGWSRMPILQNAPSSTAVFDLIRVLPSSRGQTINFEFFDAADGAGSSTAYVQVKRPVDATGSIRTTTAISGCRGAMDASTTYTPLTDCTVNVKGTTHNGRLQKMAIPIPNDYSCDAAATGGCWFQVELRFPNINVTDFTTWDANLGGDPVRLIE